VAVTERLAFNAGRTGTVERLRRPRTARYLPLFVYTPEPEPETSPTKRGSNRVATRSRAEWDWRGLLGFTAVLFLRPQDQIPAINALHLADLFALLGLAALVAGRLSRGLPPVKVTREVVGLGLFGGAILLGIPFSIWPGGAMQFFIEIVLKLLLIFVLMIAVLNRAQRIEQFAFLIVLFSGYVALRTVFDYARGVNLVEKGGRLAGAVSGMFGNPNDLALNMVVLLPFALLFAFKPGPVWRRAVTGGIALSMLATVVLTGSRGGALGLVCMVLVLVVRSVKVRPALAVGAVLATLAALPFAPASFWGRMESIVVGERDPTGSRQARIDLMTEAWNVFVSSPVVGIGVGQFENYNPPGRKEAWKVAHNAVLQVASETGLLGLVPFLFVVFRGIGASPATLRALRRPAMRRRPGPFRTLGPDGKPDPARESLVLMTTAAMPSLVGWFVAAQFASVAFNWTLYYVLAIAIATREVALTHSASGARNSPPAPAHAIAV
jgi:O-antigen ligase